jgi:alpha-glucosidase
MKLVGCLSFLVVDWIDGEFNMICLDSCICVKIADPEGTHYQVPESVFLHPTSKAVPHNPKIEFKYTESPLSFLVICKVTGEVLFNTTSFPLIFKLQYLHIKTSLLLNADIYYIGEHTELL